jgi:cobalt-precorrin-5B (C1)-methyltransferase
MARQAMIRDPVTGFEYPGAWVEACKSPGSLECVRKGLCVLTSSGTVLRRGYSTGATAAAACKASVLSLQKAVASVEVKIPCDLSINVSVTAKDGMASAFKYSGDYKADVTGGLEIVAFARPLREGIMIKAVSGIGRFTRDMPGYPAGSPAISKAAIEYIRQAAVEALAETGLNGALIELSIPRGAEIAERTLNSRLGIMGGISLLGSTGLVEPWDDHLGESVVDRVSKANKVVITTGRAGLRYSRLLFPDHEAVLVGTRIGQALGRVRGEAVICGLPALILKFIDPSILEKTGNNTIAEMSMSGEFPSIIRRCLESFKEKNPRIRIVLVDRDGKVIGDSG